MSLNGHKNWNHWNVSLWIANDEMLYRLALDCMRDNGLDEAARQFLKAVGRKTPDGAPYSKTSVIAAMRGLR